MYKINNITYPIRTIRLWLRTENLEYWGYEDPNPEDELNDAMKSLSTEVEREVTFNIDNVVNNDSEEYTIYVKTDATNDELNIMENTLTLSGWSE